MLADLGLAPLGDYGGPTPTMPLLPGSAAIGAGKAAAYPGTTTRITTDQRGLPLDSPAPDIGAFQFNPLVVNTTIDGSGSPAGDFSLRQAVNLANVFDAAAMKPLERRYYDEVVKLYDSYLTRQVRFARDASAAILPALPRATGKTLLRRIFRYGIAAGYFVPRTA